MMSGLSTFGIPWRTSVGCWLGAGPGEWAVEEAERASEAPLASIRRRRFFDPAAVGAPDSTTLLRQDRDR